MSASTLPAPMAAVTYEDYRAVVLSGLDEIQRETAAMVAVPACPPSGAGNDRPTVRACADREAA